MHGREGEEARKQQHMRTVPPRLGVPRDSDGSLSSTASSSPSFFFKDGRKISIGDCALFNLLQDSPPSIGIVCWVTVTKEKDLKLGVNWLYRPTEVKLGKGVRVEVAPNEIFYSFKKNEILASSLLHPCKVAFLPKHAELPSGITSFVCRRVYDIANRRLWWLTDKSYFYERQEEIEQLLYKTRIEMHASAQPNGRASKQMNGSMSSSQLKPGSDSLENAASVQSQGKGKKRERLDQSSDPVKRERLSKPRDGDSGQLSSESLLKSEIAKVVEKGPLVDAEGVDRVVDAMVSEINERKIDLSARIMLANIIIGTEKPDCLSRFVQTKGLTIFDDWLQDVHKGKTGDRSGIKDNDKVAEEFLLVLLRALDKLPVNLPALQMCNIGKSVNHLRTHKNLEIQKKARSLVDTWKKRVEAEMNMNDVKMGSSQGVSWSARSRLTEVAHANRSTSGSSDVAPKSPSVQLSASKTAVTKLLQGETVPKSASQLHGSIKSSSPQTSAGVNLNDGQDKSNVPLTTFREENSGSSSPSHNSSQSFSGDHVKNGSSGATEVTRSTAAASNKTPSLASRHRKASNGFAVSVASARETGPSRILSLQKNAAPDKASQFGLTIEEAADVAPAVNSHKFIVKVPNRSRSPAQRAFGGVVDDSSSMNSRPSSPALLERPDHLNAVMEETADASQANMLSDANAESLQGNDLRDTPNACDGPVDPGPSEEYLNTQEDTKNSAVASQAVTSSPRNSLKVGKVPEASMSPMSALIESCVNYAEASAPVPIGDDVGMQLLASVAAGEMVKSELASPCGSPHVNPSSAEAHCKANGPEIVSLPLDRHSLDGELSRDVGSDCNRKDHFESGAFMPRKGDIKTSPFSSDEQPVEKEDGRMRSFMDVEQLVVPSPGSNNIPKKLTVDASDAGMDIESERGRRSKMDAPLEAQCLDRKQGTKVHVDSSISHVNSVKDDIRGVKSEGQSEEGCISGRQGWNTCNGSDNSGPVEAKPSVKILAEERNEKELKTADSLKAVEVSEMLTANMKEQNEKIDPLMVLEVQKFEGTGSGTRGQVREAVSEKVSGPVPKAQSDLPLQDIDVKEKSRGCREADEMEKCNSTGVRASIAGADKDAKLEFDLNEGFGTDDGKFGESMNIITTSSAAAVPSMSPLSAPASLSSASLSAPIAVNAATAKGPFVPPDDLLRAKVEIGWKGSAATSAFRPAEPRKVLEMPTNTSHTSNSPDASLGKQSRPLLDFDLNVVDERIIEDGPACGSGGLGLDLNCASEDSTDGVNSVRSERKVGLRVLKDFDLNNDPVVDAPEPSTSGQQHLRSSTMLAHQPPLCGFRVNGAEVGSFSTWFHTGNSYSAAPVPSVISDRGEQSFPIVAAGGPQRMMGPSAGGIQFNPEIYQGPILPSSSPGLPFPSTPFQYSIFPYGTNFPLPSSATVSGSPTMFIDPSSGGRLGIPPVHSQLLGPAGAVASHFPRPYMVSILDGGGNGNVEGSKKWSRQGLDLNSGPGGPDLERRNEASPLGPKQLPTGGPHGEAEEQARMYQMSIGLLKRKDHDGGWDGYRQSSWPQ